MLGEYLFDDHMNRLAEAIRFGVKAIPHERGDVAEHVGRHLFTVNHP